MKKITSLFLAALMLLSLMPVAALAEEAPFASHPEHSEGSPSDFGTNVVEESTSDPAEAAVENVGTIIDRPQSTSETSDVGKAAGLTENPQEESATLPPSPKIWRPTGIGSIESATAKRPLPNTKGLGGA